MSDKALDKAIGQWVRLGVIYGAAPSASAPDLERLLLETARLSPKDARLFGHAVTWLAHYGDFVARHRLKRLVLTELEKVHRPALGLLLDLAIKHGASRELNLVARECGRAPEPRPLYEVHQGSTARRRLAERHASAEGRVRHLWVPDIEIKPDVLRPAAWILKRNPHFVDRIVRKGDLRAAILETLRWDVPEGQVPSESRMTELCAANRPAVSAALADLEREGALLRYPDPTDRRRTRVELSPAA